MATDQTSLNIKTVRDSHIRKALENLNSVNGKASRKVGYLYYADIKGDGRNIRSVWVVINENGGVTRSSLNARTMRKTLCAIEVETAFASRRN